MAKLAEILAALPKLPAADLDAIINHARALRAFTAPGGSPSKGAAVASPHDYLLDGLREALARRNLRVNFSAESLQRMPAYKKFSETAPAIVEWFDKLIPNMTRTERVVLGQVVAEALVLYLQTFRKKWTLGLQTLMYAYDHVPQAYECAFPGYAAQGWSRLLLSHAASGVCLNEKGNDDNGTRPSRGQPASLDDNTMAQRGKRPRR